MSKVFDGPPKAVSGPDIRMGLFGWLKEFEGFTKASFPAL